jgi:hypothetical protein
MTRPIANLADVPLQTRGDGKGFVAQVGALGPLIGEQKLGCTLVVVPPGKKISPCHRLNEMGGGMGQADRATSRTACTARFR